MTVLAVFMAALIVFMFAILFFWGLNPDQVTVALTSDLSLTQPIPIVIFGAILIGLVIGFGFHVFSLMSHGVTHWRGSRSDRRGKEVISTYREGVARLLSGDLKKAHTLLQKALSRDPRRIETYLALASVLIQEGNPDEGVVLLHKAKELDPRSMEVLFKLATSYEEISKDNESAKIYEEILALESDNRKALRSLRDLKVRLGRWSEALELQKRVLKAIGNSPRLGDEKRTERYLRYEVLKDQLAGGKVDEAASGLKELLRQDDKFFPALVSLGDAYRAQGKTEEASKVWRDGYSKLHKGVFLARLEDLYMSQEDPSSLLSLYRSQMLENGDDLLLRLFFGKLCLRLEMVDEALEQLQVVEGSGLELPQLRLLLAEGYRRRHNVEEAVRQYKKAAGIDSKLRFPFVCEACGEVESEWESRCRKCSQWGTYVLPGAQEIRQARPLEVRPIHHGER